MFPLLISFLKLNHLSRIENQLLIKGQLNGLIKLNHSRAYKFLQELQSSITDSMFTGQLASQLLGQRIQLL